mgnify:CR=1 FL=1
MMDRELNAIADEGQVALWFGELIEEADERGIHVECVTCRVVGDTESRIILHDSEPVPIDLTEKGES